jgi:NAD(P)-dependent dehydrogenase (short-subunit alcohol dehydrogenase family)
VKDFSSGNAVITGGASGIGLGLAHKLAQEGMTIILIDIEQSALESAVGELLSKGYTAHSRICDVSDRDQVEELAEGIFEEFGAVHFLANNAGVVTRHNAWESLEDWDWVLGVDLMGVIYGVHSFVPRMLASGEQGHVMNTASTAGLLAFPTIGSYNVAKRGVVALTETLHHELKGTPISTSVLCPGMVDTNIHSSERNREGSSGPSEMANAGVGNKEELSPAMVADVVVESIQNGLFWILPHAHYGEQALEQAKRRLDGGPPVLPFVDR